MYPAIFGHVKWFVNEETTKREFATINELLIIAASVIVALILLASIDSIMQRRHISSKIDSQLMHLRPWVPSVVRISAALLLLFNNVANTLLAPNVNNDGNLTHQLLAATFTLAGVLLLLGFMTRLGAALMILGYIFTFVFVDLVQPLDHLEYLGLGLYLLFMGGGRASIDEKIFDASSEWKKLQNYALPALRICVGLGLVALALSEKLFNIGLSEEFLQDYHWNFLSMLGIGDRFFVLLAGTIEIIIGLSFVFNIATRLTTLALLGVMTLTALLLGPNEIAGHIFAIGVVFAIWVNDARPQAHKSLK